MNGSRAFALASVPAAAGVAWQQYRRALRDIDARPVRAPELPGSRRQVSAPWGVATYRLVEGDPSRPAVVLIHGWGKTSDSAWWPVIVGCERTLVVVDLPGHGRSRLEEAFTFQLGADAVERVIDDARVERPLLVGHSMGGPVAITVVRRCGARAFTGLVALATSAYWVRPRLRFMMALAPFLMAPRSPLLIRTERSELRNTPDLAERIVWAYAMRPSRRLLDQTATALRRFDAREWAGLELPPTTWVVATRDGVLAPDHQRASAEYFGAEVVEVDAQHSLVIQAPQAVLEAIEGVR